MKILGFLISLVVVVVLYPFVNKFMTQVVFKSKKRTRKHMREYYELHRKEYPDESERELLMGVLHACFLILARKPDSRKPASILTQKEAEEIVQEAQGIDDLIEIVSTRGFSPDMTSWL